MDENGSHEFGFVFEVAWEVVNKVGGIYTVIRTKAGVTVEELGDDYFLFGPLNQNQCNTEVEVVEPEYKIIKDVIHSMEDEGIKIVYGRWLIEGTPKVILFDLESGRKWLNVWRKELWEVASIGIPDSDAETLNCLIFGGLVAWFLGKFRFINQDVLMTAHFHEWMAGIGLIFSRTRHLDISTVFTTHATLLGRYLCAGSIDFYNNLDKFDCDAEAGNRQIYHRYCLERSAAALAHVFTTVSQITADESEHLLKRRPDIITPNGLNIIKYTALHEFQNLHALSKEKIHEFVRGHFYGHLDFDLDKTLYFFTAGRYEFQNKGCDMFLEALARLNYLLKSNNVDVTVVAFMIFPANTNNFNVEALRGQAYVKQLRQTVNEVHAKIGDKIFEIALKGRLPKSEDLLEPKDTIPLKRCLLATQHSSAPPIVTHNMIDDQNDQILNAIRRIKLFNMKTDKVKIIFYPEFLSKTNPLFPIDYDEFVRGCHLGIFPSYYEPWGYTPAECTVMGVPNISTNLSGFGRFMADHVDYPEFYGIFIVDRKFSSAFESIHQISDHMYDFCLLRRRQRIILRNRTERLSELLDWKNLGMYYQKARMLAITKTHPERTPRVRPHKEKLNLRFPRPPSAHTSPSISRQVSDDEDDADADFRCAPDPDDNIFGSRRNSSES
ncbi:glycogen [starch] synthase, muscle isoform X2 [Hydra vulgaris]|uniref:Glycogen [starch] synthase n=1 Tax=Hydra vulgaris TaxID=6087 RepID=A0ABM4BCD6_HYDVU